MPDRPARIVRAQPPKRRTLPLRPLAEVKRPGMRLVREWDRQVHEVLVREDGFDYRGEHYRSLTQVARRITGAHWSGPRFFGIAQAAKQRRPTAQGEAPAHASR